MAACVSGLAVTLHHPVCSANHRMSSSNQQETITAWERCAEVWELCSYTHQVRSQTVLTSQLMFLYMYVQSAYSYTHTLNIHTTCSSSTFTDIQSPALVRRWSKKRNRIALIVAEHWIAGWFQHVCSFPDHQSHRTLVQHTPVILTMQLEKTQYLLFKKTTTQFYIQEIITEKSQWLAGTSNSTETQWIVPFSKCIKVIVFCL